MSVTCNIVEILREAESLNPFTVFYSYSAVYRHLSGRKPAQPKRARATVASADGMDTNQRSARNPRMCARPSLPGKHDHTPCIGTPGREDEQILQEQSTGPA